MRSRVGLQLECSSSAFWSYPYSGTRTHSFLQIFIFVSSSNVRSLCHFSFSIFPLNLRIDDLLIKIISTGCSHHRILDSKYWILISDNIFMWFCYYLVPYYVGLSPTVITKIQWNRKILLY